MKRLFNKLNPYADSRTWPPVIIMVIAIAVAFTMRAAKEAVEFSLQQAVIGVIVSILVVIISVWLAETILGR